MSAKMREEYLALLRRTITSFNIIDRNTPWQEVEPAWWSHMKDMEQKMRTYLEEQEKLAHKTYTVYGDNEGHLYSDGITRVFGENRVIKKYDGDSLFNVVTPLLVEPKEHNLEAIGVLA